MASSLRMAYTFTDSEFDSQSLRLSRGGAVTDSVEASLERDLAGHPDADPVAEAAVKRIGEIARRNEEALRAAAAEAGVSLADCQVLFELAHAYPAKRTPGPLARAFR